MRSARESASDPEREHLERVLHWKGDALASLECRLEGLEDVKHHLERDLEQARRTASCLRWALVAGAALGAWGLFFRSRTWSRTW